MGFIYLVRHGETDWNEKGKFRGHADLSLNEKGKKQAQALADYFSSREVAGVYSSPLKRAKQTAEVIARACGVPLEVRPELIDVDYGEWEGLTLEEISRVYPLLYQQWLKNPEEFTFPRGDNVRVAGDRLEGALTSLMERHLGESIVVVAHQAVNKIILYRFFKLRDRLWEIPQEVAAINLLSFEGKELKLSFYNYVEHLVET